MTINFETLSTLYKRAFGIPVSGEVNNSLTGERLPAAPDLALTLKGNPVNSAYYAPGPGGMPSIPLSLLGCPPPPEYVLRWKNGANKGEIELSEQKARALSRSISELVERDGLLKELPPIPDLSDHGFTE